MLRRLFATLVLMLVPTAALAFGHVPQKRLVLDTIAEPVLAAYSLRLVRTGYTGPAINVIRSSDSAAKDIYFARNRYLDLYSIKSFCGASTTCYVHKWYDQSGNNRTIATSATIGFDPVIMTSGAFKTTTNGQVAIYFNIQFLNDIVDTPLLYSSNGSTSMFVQQAVSQSYNTPIASEDSTSSASPLYLLEANQSNSQVLSMLIKNDSASVVLSAGSISSTPAFDGTFRTITYSDRGSSVLGYVQGTAGSSQSYTRSGTLTLNEFCIGGYNCKNSLAYPWVGYVTEAMFFPEVLSTIDRQAIEHSEEQFFGISGV